MKAGTIIEFQNTAVQVTLNKTHVNQEMSRRELYFKVENYEFGSSKGAIIFLGGTTSEHILPENIKIPSIKGGG